MAAVSWPELVETILESRIGHSDFDIQTFNTPIDLNNDPQESSAFSEVLPQQESKLENRQEDSKPLSYDLSHLIVRLVRQGFFFSCVHFSHFIPPTINSFSQTINMSIIK